MNPFVKDLQPRSRITRVEFFQLGILWFLSFLPVDWLFRYNASHEIIPSDSPVFTIALYIWLFAGCYWIASPRSRDIGLGILPAYLLLLPNAFLMPVLLFFMLPSNCRPTVIKMTKGALGLFTFITGVIVGYLTFVKLSPHWLQLSNWYCFSLISIFAGLNLFQSRNKINSAEESRPLTSLQLLDSNLLGLSYLFAVLGFVIMLFPLNPMYPKLGSSFILSGLYLWFILKRAKISQRIRNISILVLAIVSATMPTQLHSNYNGSALLSFILIGAVIRRWRLTRSVKTDSPLPHAR